MYHRRRSSVFGGLLLILVGVLILVVQLIPGVWIRFSWLWIIIGVGLLMFLVGALTGVPAMSIPACIIGGMGGILYYQNVTGNWDSWAYIWTLIPGFVGLGLVMTGLIEGEGAGSVRAGGLLLLISISLFSVFGAFFGAMGLMGDYWPVLLILLGLLLLVGALLRQRR